MDGGQRRTETGTRSRMERVSRVEPAAVRHAGGERSAQHRFPRGAAGIDKGSAAAPLVPFTAPVIKSATRRLVNGTLPPMPHASPIAGWRLTLIRPTYVGISPATPVPGVYRRSNGAPSISDAATTCVAPPSASPVSSLHVLRADNSAPGTAYRPVLPRRRRIYQVASPRRHRDPRSAPRCSPHPGRRVDRGQSSS